MIDKTDTTDEIDTASPQDSLVDALESIQDLLEKNDSKLSAAKESIALASSQAELDKLDIDDHIQHVMEEQIEIPVLDDIVIPSTGIQDQDEDNIPTLTDSVKADPQPILDYIDNLEEKLEETLLSSLHENLVSIEKELKQSLASEMSNVREQIKKDFS